MIYSKLRKVFLRHFMRMRWHTLLITLLVYVAASWCLLAFAGEHKLIGADFIYWLVVTASTVGYGDLSPSTQCGRWVTSLLIIPFGLGLFAITVGRLAAFASYYWRKGVRGLSSVNSKGHIVVIGWNGQRSLRLLQLLVKEEQQHAGSNRSIVLCCRSDKELENPLPDSIEFVKVSSFNNTEEMDRASIATASCIVINSDSDDTTMTSALFCHSRNPAAHIIVYLEDESISELLLAHCPSVECAPSVSIEMLVKAAMDPGSSALHHQLLSIDKGMTQYSVQYPKGLASVTVEKIFIAFKKQYQATLIAIASENTSIVLNPALDALVHEGTTLYYIADDRLIDFEWKNL